VVKSNNLRWAGYVAGMEVKTGVCKVLVGRRNRKKPLGRAAFKWELNIQTDVLEICWRAWSALIWITEKVI